MSDLSQKPDNIKKSSLGKAVGLIFAIIFFLSAIGSFSYSPIIGTIFIVVGLMLLPWANDFVQKRFNFVLSGKVKTVSITALLILAVIAMPKVDVNNNGQQKQSQNYESLTSAQPSVTPSSSNLAESKSTPEPKTEQQIVEEKLKAISSASYRSIEIEKADSDRPQGSKMITASFNAPSFWDKDGLLRDTGKISSQVFQTIFNSKLAAYDVFVWYYGDTTDRYGNKKNDVVLTYHTYKPTFDKINWPSFDQRALCDFLNQENRLNPEVVGNACTVLAKIE